MRFPTVAFEAPCSCAHLGIKSVHNGIQYPSLNQCWKNEIVRYLLVIRDAGMPHGYGGARARHEVGSPATDRAMCNRWDRGVIDAPDTLGSCASVQGGHAAVDIARERRALREVMQRIHFEEDSVLQAARTPAMSVRNNILLDLCAYALASATIFSV